MCPLVGKVLPLTLQKPSTVLSSRLQPETFTFTTEFGVKGPKWFRQHCSIQVQARCVCACHTLTVIFSLQLARVGLQRDWGQRGPFRDPVQSGQYLVLCRWCSVVTLRLTRSRENKLFQWRKGPQCSTEPLALQFPCLLQKIQTKAMAKGQPCAACSLVFWDSNNSWLMFSSAKKTDDRCILSPHRHRKGCGKMSVFFLTSSVHKWEDFNGDN